MPGSVKTFVKKGFLCGDLDWAPEYNREILRSGRSWFLKANRR